MIETKKQISAKYDTTHVRDGLYLQLDSIVPTIVDDVDQYLSAKDDATLTSTPRKTRATTPSGRRHDRKRKRMEVNRARRQRETFRRNRTATVTAFNNAELQPVVI